MRTLKTSGPVHTVGDGVMITAWRHGRMVLWILISSVIAVSVSWPRPLHPSASDTLAVVGRKVITSDQFARSFRDKLQSIGLSDNGDTRIGYLRNLVDDEVLIAEARNKKLDRTRKASREAKRIRVQELLNAYMDKHILAAVEVTESDLQELFHKMNAKVKVRHLYAQTRERADSIYAALSRGRTFEELAGEEFTDQHLRDSGGSLGYVSFDEMDPAFERTMYALRPGEISHPVKTVHGYSIIRVDDIQRNPFVTESEFLKAKARLRSYVRKQKCEEAATQHVAALRATLGVQFNEPVLDRLYAATRQNPLHDVIENRSLGLSAADVKTAAVTSALGTWSVRTLIDALRDVPEGQRRWIHTRENFEDFIAGLVVRRYIAREAAKEHLDSVPAFREKVDYAFDTYLLTTLEDQLRGRIRISPDSVQSYYQHNQNKFTTELQVRLSGILLDDVGTRDSLCRLLEGGADFGEVARQFSIQRATAEHGGDLGYFAKGQLGRFGDQILAMTNGEWRGPFVEGRKQLFVKRTGVKESVVRPLQDCSQEIEGILVTLAWQTARSRYVESAKSTVHCRTYPAKVLALSLNN